MLCIRLAGWKLIYEPSLKISHFIPRTRLSWKYLRKLNRGFGAQKVGLEPYLKAFESDEREYKSRPGSEMAKPDLTINKKIKKTRYP